MHIWVTLWWLLFVSAVGLCLGSFLNVVIYRIPRDKSLRSPLWSACPHCAHRIRWHDNLPVVSFLRLRGRCRDCGASISTRYLIIEVLMALVTLILLDAFFIGEIRSGLTHGPFGITEGLSLDWPIFTAHLILFACLLSMSAIDLEHYWVDVRFTNLATVCGFALHVLWTPKHSSDWLRPLDSTATACLFALTGLLFVWVIAICRPHMDPEDFGDTEGEFDSHQGDLIEFPVEAHSLSTQVPQACSSSGTSDQDGGAGGLAPGAVPSSPSATHADTLPVTLDTVETRDDEFSAATEDEHAQAPQRWGGWLVLTFFVVLFATLVVVEESDGEFPHWPRALVPLALLFGIIVHQGRVARESDQQIMEAIEEESPGARRMACAEFGLLLPAIVLAFAGLLLYWGSGDFVGRVTSLLHIDVQVPGIPMMRHWQPFYGLATAASGYVIAGALGWAVRIVFTLVFGREAFGAGDIHLMAAAGCIAGWPVVLLGFFLACGLAIVGWLASMPFKRTRAIPLGPWLSLSFLVVVVFYEPITRLPAIARVIAAGRMLLSHGSQLAIIGGVS